MGKTILADESIQSYITELLSKGQWQLGLIIGHVGCHSPVISLTESVHIPISKMRTAVHISYQRILRFLCKDVVAKNILQILSDRLMYWSRIRYYQEFVVFSNNF